MNKTAKISFSAILIMAMVIGLFYMASTLAVAPSVSTIVTGDDNADGTIDRLVVTFSADIENTTDGTGFTVSGSSCTKSSASETSAGVMTFVLSSCAAGTSVKPDLSYDSNTGDIEEAGAGTDELATFGPSASTDGAKPVFTAARTALNTIVLTFSENVDADSVDETTAWTVAGATVNATTDPGNTNTLTITTTGLTSTSSTPLVTYDADFGTVVDDAVPPNEVADGKNANAADQVAPAFVSARFTSLTQLEMTFSENMGIAGTVDETKITLTNNAGDPIAVTDNSASVATTKITVTVANVGSSAFKIDTGGQGLDLTAGAVQDSAANSNAETLNNAVTDGILPTVTAVNVNDALLTETNVGTDVFVATIDFSEVMDTTEPTIAFSPAVGSTLANCNGTWSDTNTYQYSCDVADGDVDEADVDIDVSGAKDVALNTMAADTSSGDDKFDIDTIKPTVTSIDVNDPLLSIADAGDGAFIVTINFDEDMNEGSVPGIVFSPTLDTTLTDCGGVWSDADTYTYTCDVAAVSVEEPNVDIQVSGAQDLALNTMAEDTETGVNEFGVDTAMPSFLDVVLGDDGYINAEETLSGVDIVVTTSGVEDGQNVSCVLTDTGVGSVGPVTGEISGDTVTIASGDLSSLLEGLVTVTCSVTDAAGNPTPFDDTDTALKDTEEPLTSDDFAFDDTWTDGNQTITIIPSDVGSDVDTTMYCTDTGDPCDPYLDGDEYVDVPIEISTEGVSYLRYSSTDNAGNVQETFFRTIKIDTIQPDISNSIVDDLDMFYSPGLSVVNIQVNASDEGSSAEEGSLEVSATISDTDCEDVPLVYNFGSGFYEGSCDVASAIVADQMPDLHTITITALDDVGNPAVEPDAIEILLHDMGQPVVPHVPLPFGGYFMDDCFMFGDQTTDFSAEDNFNDIAFTIDLWRMPSCFGQPGDEFIPATLISLESVDLSTKEAADNLQNLMQAIDVDIAPPNTFGESRIYNNSSFFAELNTSATIKLYYLPFTSEPEIVPDEDAAGLNEGIETEWEGGFDPVIGSYVGNLTFTVNGFSGYNPEDTANPTIEFLSPTELALAAHSVLLNVSINGTGTPLSYVEIAVNSLGGDSYYYYIPDENNSAGCDATEEGGDFYICAVSLTLADNDYSISVTANDYGGDEPGNQANEVALLQIDTTAPETTDDTLGTWYGDNPTITLLPDPGVGSDIASTRYCFYRNGSAACDPTTGDGEEGTSVTPDCAPGELCEIVILYYSTDALDNVEEYHPALNNPIYIDMENPTVGTPEIYSGAYTDSYYKGMIGIRALVGDGTGSGINEGNCEYTLNSEAEVPEWVPANYDDEGGYCYMNLLEPGVDISIAFRVPDIVGNPGTSSSKGYTYDGDAPTTNYVSTQEPSEDPYSPGEWSTENISVTLSCDDGGAGCNVTYYCYSPSDGCDPMGEGDGHEYVGPVSITTDGTWYFRYQSVDEVGNANLADEHEIVVKIDQTGPDTTLTATTAEDDEYTSDFEANTANVTYTYECDDALDNGCTAYFCTAENCTPDPEDESAVFSTEDGETIVYEEEGTYYFRSMSIDDLDNVGQITEMVAVIDSTKPVVDITSPANRSSSSSNVNVAYTLTEANTQERCWWTLDGGAVEHNITCGTSVTHQSWATGTRTVRVYAEDEAGNIGTDSVTFTKTVAAETSGGGGAFISPEDKGWTFTMTVSDEQLLDGFQRALAKNERFKFRVGGEDHSVGVVAIDGNLVTIQIWSNPQTATLSVGQSSKFDVNNDGYYEVYVKVNSVSGGVADVTVQSIYEKIPAATQPPAATTPQEDVVPEASTPAACSSDWSCGAWSECTSGSRARVCVDKNACATPSSSKPAETEACRAPFKLPWLTILIAAIIVAVLSFAVIFYMQKRYERDD